MRVWSGSSVRARRGPVSLFSFAVCCPSRMGRLFGPDAGDVESVESWRTGPPLLARGELPLNELGGVTVVAEDVEDGEFGADRVRARARAVETGASRGGVLDGRELNGVRKEELCDHRDGQSREQRESHGQEEGGPVREDQLAGHPVCSTHTKRRYRVHADRPLSFVICILHVVYFGFRRRERAAPAVKAKPCFFDKFLLNMHSIKVIFLKIRLEAKGNAPIRTGALVCITIHSQATGYQIIFILTLFNLLTHLLAT